MKERGQLKNIVELAAESMKIFEKGYDGSDVRLDAEYQETLPEFFKRRDALTPADIPGAFSALYR